MARSTHGITGDLLCGKLVDKAHCPSRSVLQGPFFQRLCFAVRGQVIPNFRCAKVPFHNSGYGPWGYFLHRPQTCKFSRFHDLIKVLMEARAEGGRDLGI